MSESLTRPASRTICRLPNGEAKGLVFIDIPNGPKGIIANVSDRIYLINEEDGSYREITSEVPRGTFV